MDNTGAEFGGQGINPGQPLSKESGDTSLPIIETGTGKAIAANVLAVMQEYLFEKGKVQHWLALHLAYVIY